MSNYTALIKKVVTRVYDLFEKELDAPMMAMWLESLDGQKIAHVELAFRRYIKHGVFAPKPANILALISEIKQEQASGFSAHARTAYESDPMLEAQYTAAAFEGANSDRGKSIAGWKKMQDIGVKMGAHYQVWARRAA